MTRFRRNHAMQDTAAIRLNVVPVAPKDRYETIMGAYDSLAVGGVLELTVDHEPSCLYYALRGLRGEGTFRFDYVERGPEVWRGEVRKDAAGTGS
jgi:uncharacterized protein (DUF2249 family)